MKTIKYDDKTSQIITTIWVFLKYNIKTYNPHMLSPSYKRNVKTNFRSVKPIV